MVTACSSKYVSLFSRVVCVKIMDSFFRFAQQLVDLFVLIVHEIGIQILEMKKVGELQSLKCQVM